MQIQSDDEMGAALKQLLALADVNPGADAISASDVYAAIREIKSRMDASASSSSAFSAPAFNASDESSGEAMFGGSDPFASMASFVQGDPKPKREGQQEVLIVSALGIVTYQLKLSLSKLGHSVTIVKGIDEAINEYQRNTYDGVLIDIFMPTQREGMLVLKEIKAMEREKMIRSNIVVLATPMKEKNMDLKGMCLSSGATEFFEKTEGWHQRVIGFFSPESA